MSASFRQFTAARDELLAAIEREANKLKPGESVSIPLLVKLRPSNKKDEEKMGYVILDDVRDEFIRNVDNALRCLGDMAIYHADNQFFASMRSVLKDVCDTRHWLWNDGGFSRGGMSTEQAQKHLEKIQDGLAAFWVLAQASQI